jgi:acetyltransferase-like isoleucine patch superfamily enzyme
VNFVVHEPSDIVADGELSIGDHCNIRPFVSIICKHKITIGEGTQIAAGARIVDFDHDLTDPEAVDLVGNCSPVVIGRKCWIGANAVVLKGVSLGDYCVVGAGAVVTRSYPSGTVLIGNPAKPLRNRL